MIVRILGEGQYDVDESHLDALNELDRAVESAIESGDDEAFETSLHSLFAAVRDWGSPLDDAALVDSDLILPPTDATADEVQALLGDEGLIPDAL
ncbi:MAG: PspA-associated protein PspAA [Nocardioidaceae bacterium]